MGLAHPLAQGKTIGGIHPADAFPWLRQAVLSWRVEVGAFVIFLLQLLCPHGHVNGGTPVEHPAAEPPDEWLHAVSRQTWERAAKAAAEQWPQCGLCSEAFSARWTIGASRTKWTSIAEALDVLSRSDGKVVEPAL